MLNFWRRWESKVDILSFWGLRVRHTVVTVLLVQPGKKQEWEVEIAQAAAAMEQPHMWFTDGSGLENGHRGGAAWCPTTRTTTKQYLGRLATVHDGELAGIDGALQNSPNANVLLLTDSEAAILTTLNLARGAAPRSGIELSIMERLAARKRQGKQTKIAWVKAHAGLPGNEEADRLAKSAAALRLQRNGLELVTHARLREVITAARKKARALAWDAVPWQVGARRRHSLHSAAHQCRALPCLSGIR